MLASKFLRLIVIAFALSCTVVHAQSETNSYEAQDHLEGLNRITFNFNRAFDSMYLKPAYTAYDKIFPMPIKESVTNFVHNMNTVPIIISDILAAKFVQAGQDILRLAVNSTLGLAGIFDVATPIGLPAHKQNLGKVFYQWGWKESSYFIIPILGPSTVRDALGLLGELFMYPPQYWQPKWRNRYYALAVIQRRGSIKEFEIVADVAGVNYYNLMRSGYLQNRQYELTDGQSVAHDEGGADMLGEPPA